MRSNLTFNQTLSGNRSLILRRLLILRLVLLLLVLLAFLGHALFLDGKPHVGVYVLPLVGFFYTCVSFILSRANRKVTDAGLLRQLCFDGVFLLVLIYFTGGATNPFIYYLLVLVAISAAIFNPLVAWVYSIACMLAYTALMFSGIKEHLHHMSSDFQLHLLGMWVNFVGSAALICFFVSRLATALRDRQIELSRVREETLKNEQLVGIGTLAASTVHALGTPLSTMAVLLGEMEHAYSNKPKNSAVKSNLSSQQNQDIVENVSIMLSQIERCKQTLSKLTQLSQQGEGAQPQESLSHFVAALKEHYLLANPKVLPSFHFVDQCERQGDSQLESLVLEKSILLKHALINLIDNAVHAANEEVCVNISIDTAGPLTDLKRSGFQGKRKNDGLKFDQWITFNIQDDGDGLPNHVANQWGKPIASKKESGMGIGIFLSNSTVEKLGGKVEVCSTGSSLRSSGTSINVILPLAVTANS